MQEEKLRRALRPVAQALDRLNANWFIEGGTCLGYLRDGRPIAWDWDIDVGIYDPRIDFRQLRKRLPVMAFFGYDTSVTQAKIWPMQLDIFRFFDYRGSVAETVHFPKGKGEAPEAKFFLYPKDIFEAGVERVLFCGVECNVLRRAHEYCRTLYGESYLIPDPQYDSWEGPKNGVKIDSETIFMEDVPISAWSRLCSVWRFEGPASVARRGLEKIGRQLATALVSRVGSRKSP